MCPLGFFQTCYCTLSRLQYSINKTFLGTGKPQIRVTRFVAYLLHCGGMPVPQLERWALLLTPYSLPAPSGVRKEVPAHRDLCPLP